jgi:MoaA/NifB/PqqE/SkfB family radical SAM enzyme
MTERSSKPFLDIIWNTTLVCPFDCAICCVDAVHVRRRGRHLELRSASLADSTILRYVPGSGSVYAQAAAFRQRQGLELDLDGKLRVLEHLEDFDPKLDFSGGDALSVPDTIPVMREAVRRFGRDRVTITVTGAGADNCRTDELAELVGEFNFTFDTAPTRQTAHRPPMYANRNLAKGRELAAAGIRTRAELPLTKANCDPASLRAIYLALHEAGIRSLLLMRLFTVGRAAGRKSDVPNRPDYLSAIRELRALETEFGAPTVSLQCALKHLEPDHGNGANPCDMVRESFGVSPDGTLLKSPWAINSLGAPIHPSWILGNLAEQPLGRLLGAGRVRQMKQRLDENFGHCKIFAYLNGRSDDPEERIFERSDPLFSGDTVPTMKGDDPVAPELSAGEVRLNISEASDGARERARI